MAVSSINSHPASSSSLLFNIYPAQLVGQFSIVRKHTGANGNEAVYFKAICSVLGILHGIFGLYFVN